MNFFFKNWSPADSLFLLHRHQPWTLLFSRLSPATKHSTALKVSPFSVAERLAFGSERLAFWPMAAANQLFAAVAAEYAKAVPLADSIYTQISSLKRWNSNAEMDRLHTLYHNEHQAPATGEEQKLALHDASLPRVQRMLEPVWSVYLWPMWAGRGMITLL